MHTSQSTVWSCKNYIPQRQAFALHDLRVAEITGEYGLLASFFLLRASWSYLDSDKVLMASTAFPSCYDTLLVCFLITSILIPRLLVFTQEVI